MARLMIAVLALAQAVAALALDSSVNNTTRNLRGQALGGTNLSGAIDQQETRTFHWKFDLSLCISKENENGETSTSTGQKVELRKCGDVGAGDPSQLFDLTPGFGYYEPVQNFSQIKLVTNKQLCVEIDGIEDKKGAHIQLGQCSDSGSRAWLGQQWSIDNYGLIRNYLYNDKCIIVTATYSGRQRGELALWSCDEAEQLRGTSYIAWHVDSQR